MAPCSGVLPDRQRIELKLLVSPWLAAHLEETPLADTQIFTTDPQGSDHCVLETEVLDGMQLRRWLLSQGAGLQVLEPEPLRKWMREIVREQAHSYML